MAELDVGPDRTLMIGDTSHDMKMAHAAGAPRLGIAHGAHARATLLEHEPLACVEDLAELREWLLRHA
jgi:phosphoglycolate phosphatase